MSAVLSINEAQREAIDLYGIEPLFIGLEGDVHGIVRRRDGDERITDYAVTTNGTVFEVTYRAVRDGKVV